MWLEISKRNTYSVHPTSGKLYVDILLTLAEYRLLIFLAISQVLWHFEILTWESMGNPKIHNILKRAGSRVLQTDENLAIGALSTFYV